MVQAAESEKRTVGKGQDETDGQERTEEKNNEQKEERNERKDGEKAKKDGKTCLPKLPTMPTNLTSTVSLEGKNGTCDLFKQRSKNPSSQGE